MTVLTVWRFWRAPCPLLLVLQNTVPRSSHDGYDGFGGFGGCGGFSRDGYPPKTQPYWADSRESILASKKPIFFLRIDLPKNGIAARTGRESREFQCELKKTQFSRIWPSPSKIGIFFANRLPTTILICSTPVLQHPEKGCDRPKCGFVNDGAFLLCTPLPSASLLTKDAVEDRQRVSLWRKHPEKLHLRNGGFAKKSRKIQHCSTSR